MLSDQEIKEHDKWGREAKGYQVGGNYEDNPDLDKFSLMNYMKLK